MLRSQLLKTLLVVTLGGSAMLLACGPLFPPGMLNRGADSLLAAPWQAFQTTLNRLTPSSLRTKAIPPAYDESLREQQLHAELAELAQAGASADLLYHYHQFRARFAAHPESTNLTVPADLPAEYRLYLAGALALNAGDIAAARDQFSAVLALPPEQRQLKATSAAYMLGVIDHRDENRYEPSPRFTQVRELAAAGFADSQGLAAASYGQEARLHYLHENYLRAIPLYLKQNATGDPTAANSLSFCADHILDLPQNHDLTLYATDPVARQVVSARLLTYNFESYDPEQNLATARRWMHALEKAGVQDQPEAETLALIAYKIGDPKLAAEWLALAPPDGVPARWIRAKLALRKGDTQTAIKILTNLIREPALDGYFIEQPYGRESLHSTKTIPGELGALHLARRDFNEALRLFLRGDYWEDAAYVAERILSTEELIAYIQTNSTADENTARLRHLLARRLFREGQLTQARPWFPSGVQLQLDRYTTSLTHGRDKHLSHSERADALMTAARVLREHGMDLAGTELDPDYFIQGGYFLAGITLEGRIALAGPAAPSREEIRRANQSLAEPALRYHYRFQAADLAWEAAILMPDNSPKLAASLMEAGGWIKNHNPQSADRFYKALVTRCPETETGRLAKAQRWFPATTSK